MALDQRPCIIATNLVVNKISACNYLISHVEDVYLQQCLGIPYTVDMERFAGLNIRGFSHMSFLQKYFRSALATSVYYLPIS